VLPTLDNGSLIKYMAQANLTSLMDPAMRASGTNLRDKARESSTVLTESTQQEAGREINCTGKSRLKPMTGPRLKEIMLME
jgi:hypothetical protein